MGLFCFDVKDANLRICAIPVGLDSIEDQAKILLATGLERGCGNGLDINIRFAHADELEGLGFILRDLVGVVAEEYLHGDAGDDPGALVRDMAIEVGDLASSQIAGFAHGKTGEREIGRIGVKRRGDGRDAVLAMDLAVFQGQDQTAGNQQDDGES